MQYVAILLDYNCIQLWPFCARKIADIVSNVLLVVIPLFILRHTRLPKASLYMIRAVFVTTICMISICTIRVIYAMRNNIPLNGLITNLEVSLVTRSSPRALTRGLVQAAVTLLMCNLLVLVTFVYRHIRNGRDLDHELSEYLSRARGTPVVHGLTSFTSISAPELPDSAQLTTGRGTSLFLEAGCSLLGMKGEVIVSSVLTPRIAAPGLSSNPLIMSVHPCRSAFPSPEQQSGKSIRKSKSIS